MTTPELQCPWCSAELPAAADKCPSCGAALTPTPTAQAGIPGLTEVPPELLRYAEAVRTNKKRPGILKMIFSDTDIPTVDNAPPPSDADALRPPNAAVKAQMERIDYEIAVSAVASGADTDPFAEIGPAAVEPAAVEPAVEPTAVEPAAAALKGSEHLPEPEPRA